MISVRKNYWIDWRTGVIHVSGLAGDRFLLGLYGWRTK